MQISRRTALTGAVVVATVPATTAWAAKKAESTSSAFKPDVKTVEVGDISMAYYTRGEGEPLLLINGFMASMSLWDPALIEALAERHRLILFDNRGVGRSTDTEKDVTTIRRWPTPPPG